MEQYSRWDFLEIKGIRGDSEEDTNAIVIQLSSFLDVNLDSRDISMSHRIQTMRQPQINSIDVRKNPPLIIVKFVRIDLRNLFYRARKKLKYMTTKDMMNLSHLTENNIYMSESLSLTNKELWKCILESPLIVQLNKSEDSPRRYVLTLTMSTFCSSCSRYITNKSRVLVCTVCKDYYHLKCTTVGIKFHNHILKSGNLWLFSAPAWNILSPSIILITLSLKLWISTLILISILKNNCQS